MGMSKIFEKKTQTNKKQEQVFGCAITLWYMIPLQMNGKILYNLYNRANRGDQI